MEIKTRWAQDRSGNVLPFASVSLFYEGTTDLVSGLEDSDGNPLSNPFQADVNGKAVFAAPDGQYDIEFSAGPRESRASIQFLDVSGALQVVEDIDTLRSITGNNGRDYMLVKFHTSDGDGGGGEFYWVDGAAPGTYVDNGGTVIVPTGGDGSEAWVREFDGDIEAVWFGIELGSSSASIANHAALRAWLDVVVSEEGCGKLPAGDIWVFGPGASSLRSEVVNSISIKGAGSGATRMIRGNGTLSNAGTKSSKFFDLICQSGVTGINISFSGITFVGNSAGQETPSPITNYQQSHCIFIRPRAIRGVQTFSADDIVFDDPIAGGISFGGTSVSETFGDINISNVFGYNRPYTRADIELLTSWDGCNFSNMTLTSLEVETNTIASGHSHELNLSNITTDELDLNLKGAQAAGVEGHCFATNLVAKRVIALDDFNFRFVNFDITLAGIQEINRGRHRYYGGRFHAAASFTSSALFQHGLSNRSKLIEFDKVEFTADPAVTSITRVFYDNNAAQDYTEEVLFTDCDFAITTARAMSHRAGRFRFHRCKFRTSSASYTTAVSMDGNWNSGTDNRMTFIGCHTVDPAVYLWNVNTTAAAGSEPEIYFRDNRIVAGFLMPSLSTSDIASPYGSGTAIIIRGLDDYLQTDQVALDGSSFPTTGRFFRGQRLYYADPNTVGYVGCVCTVTGAPGTWKKFGALV